MRNPGKRRTISIVVALVAAVTVVGTHLQHRGETTLGAWFTVLVISAHVTIFALVGVMVFHFNYRNQQRLVRGEKLLARWTVSAADWHTFTENERERKAAGRHNNFRLREEYNSGVDVLIAEQSIMIADDFYHLGNMRGLQWIPDPLPCLEYNMVTAGKSGSVKWNVRFPVPAAEQGKARAVWDFVHPPNQPDPSIAELARLNRIRKRTAVVAVACAPLLAYGIRGLSQHSTSLPVLVSLGVGLIGTGSGGLSSLLTHLMYKSRLRAQTRAQ